MALGQLPPNTFHEKAEVVNGRRGDQSVVLQPMALSPRFHPHSEWAQSVSPVPVGVRSRWCRHLADGVPEGPRC